MYYLYIKVHISPLQLVCQLCLSVRRVVGRDVTTQSQSNWGLKHHEVILCIDIIRKEKLSVFYSP